MEKKNEINSEIIVNSFVVILILLAIAIIFWPQTKNKNQSNELDESKTQIKVIVKRINIRKEPTILSEDIGDVYEGEIYTVLEHIDNSDYYWYKITTNNNVTGYIASDPKSEYVTVISGIIDRIAPEITFNENYLLFYNGEISLDEIICIDNYSSCKLDYTIDDYNHLTISATDDDGNISKKKVKYYSVYNTNYIFKESNNYITANFKKTYDNNFVTISSSYTLNKGILNENKSFSYQPIINFYDENFIELRDIYTEYKISAEKSCINDANFSLKEEFYDKNLQKGDTLCIDYSFKNNDKIKYFSFGFSGIENYNNDNNYLANYYSKYYIN